MKPSVTGVKGGAAGLPGSGMTDAQGAALERTHGRQGPPPAVGGGPG
jgi:hypothetical protein